MTITGIVFHCIVCFRKINNLVPIAICIHPLMYGKLCRAQKQQYFYLVKKMEIYNKMCLL
jgi:hypothetical protein